MKPYWSVWAPGTRKHHGAFTEKTALGGVWELSWLRREEVQVEGLRPTLRDGHDSQSTVSRPSCLEFVVWIKKKQERNVERLAVITLILECQVTLWKL